MQPPLPAGDQGDAASGTPCPLLVHETRADPLAYALRRAASAEDAANVITWVKRLSAAVVNGAFRVARASGLAGR